MKNKNLRINGFKQQRDLLDEKLIHLRKAHAIETDTSIRFKLEKQIEQAENECNEIESRLRALQNQRVIRRRLIWGILLFGVIVSILLHIVINKQAISHEEQLLAGRQEKEHKEDSIDLIITYAYRHQGEKELKPFTNDLVLQSGDLYKIIFTPVEDGYVYIFQIDSADKIYRLFPMETFQEATVGNVNPVYKNTNYYIPGEKQSFELDNQTGHEKLIVFATKNRDEILEGYSQELIMAQNQHNKALADLAHKNLVGLLKTRKSSQAISLKKTGNAFSIIRQQLEHCDTCLDVISFQHE